jgi:type IV pilus assembly protein PilA
MNKFIKSKLAEEKGFTLIELLIVIVILGVLAAAIIPNLSKFVGSGQLGAANAELASVQTGVSAYTANTTSGTIPAAAYTAATMQTLIGTYISGTIVGAYTVNADGTITGTASNRTGITWDATNKKWQKP